MGRTIVKLIKVVEFLKKNVAGLHIAYKIGEIPFEETFQPLYEGLKEVKAIVKKPAMTAIFTFNEKLVKNEVGYQTQERVDQEKSNQFIEKAKGFKNFFKRNNQRRDERESINANVKETKEERTKPDRRVPREDTLKEANEG